MELGKIMKSRWATLGLTQEDIAEMVRTGLSTVKDIERYKGNPSLSTISKILDILGIEIIY